VSAVDALHAKVYDLEEQLTAAEAMSSQQRAALDSMSSMHAQQTEVCALERERGGLAREVERPVPSNSRGWLSRGRCI
jgi:hypothetical protein